MTVWKNTDWRRKHRIHGFIWGLIIACVPTGIILGLVKAWWGGFVTPLLGLTLAQILELPLIDVVAGVLWFFVCPELILIAIACVIAGIATFMDAM